MSDLTTEQMMDMTPGEYYKYHREQGTWGTEACATLREAMTKEREGFDKDYQSGSTYANSIMGAAESDYSYDHGRDFMYDVTARYEDSKKEWLGTICDIVQDYKNRNEAQVVIDDSVLGDYREEMRAFLADREKRLQEEAQNGTKSATWDIQAKQQAVWSPDFGNVIESTDSTFTPVNKCFEGDFDDDTVGVVNFKTKGREVPYHFQEIYNSAENGVSNPDYDFDEYD